MDSVKNENEDSKRQNSQGASSLLGLFAEPPSGNSNSNMNYSGSPHPSNMRKDDPKLAAAGRNNENPINGGPMKNNEKKDQLLGLFTPPQQVKNGPSSSSEFGNSTSSDANSGKEKDDDLSTPIPSPPPSGSVSHMMNLFGAPKSVRSSYNDNSGHVKTASLVVIPDSLSDISSGRNYPSRPLPITERQSTEKRSNTSNRDGEQTPLLSYEQNSPSVASSSSFLSGSHSRDSSLRDLFVSSTEATPKTGVQSRKAYASTLERGSHSRIPSAALPSIVESKKVSGKAWYDFFSSVRKMIFNNCLQPTTYIGSFMFLFYHLVFCLAVASAIIRQNNSTSILGLMTKTATLGIACGASVYWIALGRDVPAMYPTVDLFLAPFLANLAAIVDQALADDDSVTDEDNDVVFLVTFGVLTAIGICCSGALLTLASIFKLANLGSFLPFPVICGFFSAVGVLNWTLAISVDTNGNSAGSIIFSGDKDLILKTLVHHIPGVIVAALMKHLGPKNPFYVVIIVICTVASFHIIFFLVEIPLEEAQERGWFWSKDDLVYTKDFAALGGWSTSAPFGVLNGVRKGLVHWGAVFKGMSTAIALGFLYMIRCSVHGTALKKNVSNLYRVVRGGAANSVLDQASPANSPKPVRPPIKKHKFSEAVDIEAVMQSTSSSNNDTSKPIETVIRPKPTNIALKTILSQYGYSQFVSALVGGFAITPSVAASGTMFTLGAERIAPQVGSVLLLVAFYFNNFQLLQYIPKPAFSSMLVLSFIDMIDSWFYKPYFKTKDKLEWMVVPAIVVAAFTLDLLSSVFVGIALSTFIFVASFFRSGVVKFVADGLMIHSSIERSFKHAKWLNSNGGAIQIVVLQNYLFFGNASNVYMYICGFFQNGEDEQCNGQPTSRLMPKFVVIDLTLVTGMDTSTVDVFADIKSLCATNNCKLFMAGASPSVRSVLAQAGVKPESGNRSKRKLRFFQNLDAALGKAEDILLDFDIQEQNTVMAAAGNRHRLLSEGDHGFRTALRHIDEQHGDNFSMELVGLLEYTTPVELKAGERLYQSGDTMSLERGLFFIECGLMKIERNAGETLTRGSFGSNSGIYFSGSSLNKISSLYSAMAKGQLDGDNQTFRLARIGPGWVAGTLEAVSGMRRPGEHVALTQCRLWHLPFSKLAEIETKNPHLILSLYKLLSYLMARRQEATIGQLATLHSIMASPPHTRSLRY